MYIVLARGLPSFRLSTPCINGSMLRMVTWRVEMKVKALTESVFVMGMVSNDEMVVVLNVTPDGLLQPW